MVLRAHALTFTATAATDDIRVGRRDGARRRFHAESAGVAVLCNFSQHIVVWFSVIVVVIIDNALDLLKDLSK